MYLCFYVSCVFRSLCFVLLVLFKSPVPEPLVQECRLFVVHIHFTLRVRSLFEPSLISLAWYSRILSLGQELTTNLKKNLWWFQRARFLKSHTILSILVSYSFSMCRHALFLWGIHAWYYAYSSFSYLPLHYTVITFSLWLYK